MPTLRSQQTIIGAVRDIAAGRYRLPSIQRSFVWEEYRIYKLLDSLMKGYPIGAFLLWKPGSNLQVRTRKFVHDYTQDQRFISRDETLGSGTYLVLDGQQRLQSLYLALSGTYSDKGLYFRADSSEGQDSDMLYQFKFLGPNEVTDSRWIRVSVLQNLKIEEIPEFVESQFPSIVTELRRLVVRNLNLFFRVFLTDEKLSLQEVEESLDYNDVLEVFVRVNSGGMVLSKSDLVFSTVKISSPTMENNFNQLLNELNGGNREFDFDIDFLVKTSFVVLGAGAKYDVNKLKNSTFVRDLDQRFHSLERTLLSTLEFLKNDARILSKRFLRSDLALIPIIDYIFGQPCQQIPDSEVPSLRQYLYMSFFLNFYSYGADSKLDVIHRMIKEPTGVFPLEKVGQFMSERTNTLYGFSGDLLNDSTLVLNIVQGGVSEIQKKRGWSLEQDHIFPKSTLTKLGVPERLRDDVGNLRYLAKTRNILKSDVLPEENLDFYGHEDPDLHELFFRALRNLSTESYSRFCSARRERIHDKVRTFLGFRAHDGIHTEKGADAPEAAGPNGLSPTASEKTTTDLLSVGLVQGGKEAWIDDGTLSVQNSAAGMTDIRAEAALVARDDAPMLLVEEKAASLRNRYCNDAVTRMIFDHLRKRQRNRKELNLDKLGADLRSDGTPLTYQEIKNAMKWLASLGIGKYRRKRGDEPTRFIWSIPLMDVSRLATVESIDAEATDLRRK